MKDSEIVACTVQGEPLTRELYIQKVKDCDDAMDRGKIVSSGEVRAAILSW